MNPCNKTGPHGEICRGPYRHPGPCTWQRSTPPPVPPPSRPAREVLVEADGTKVSRPQPNLLGKIIGATALAIVGALVVSLCVWAIVAIWRVIL